MRLLRPILLVLALVAALSFAQGASRRAAAAPTPHSFQNTGTVVANKLSVFTTDPGAMTAALLTNAPGCPIPTIAFTSTVVASVTYYRIIVSWASPCVQPLDTVTLEYEGGVPDSVFFTGPTLHTFTDDGSIIDGHTLTIIAFGSTPATVPLIVNPAGCPAPTMTIEGVAGVEFVITVSWGTSCVQPGDSVTLEYEGSDFFAYFSGSPGAPPPPPPPPQGPYLALDCDTATPGIQDNCTVSLGQSSLDVDVVFVSDPALQLAAFNFEVQDGDTSRLNPPPVPDPPDWYDSNPDVNQALFPSGYQCSTPPPDNDTGTGGPGIARSFLSCFRGVAPFIPISAASETAIATVHYDIPAAEPGSVPLTFRNVAMYDNSFIEIGSCNPVLTNTFDCLPATITLVPSPAVAKEPEGNAANADPSVPKANLWLCVAPAACAGMGEGNLRIVEFASSVFSDYDADGISDAIDPDIAGTGLSNTELGLGTYEFSVEYDNFVIQSVNPCDIVFGPGGAGSARGPVDELNSSSPANPDCTPDPNSSADGMCSMSLVLENVIRFGCVTTGSTPYGPFGSFPLASLNLIPHPDLTNDIFPGNNNGVITVLKDNGCELADILGHPVAGSINGGLTQTCGDLAVTVRILEGDLNLDCKVDVTDEQLISFRYGAFFGDLSYTKWHDLEPATHDLDIDIKDLQKVFGRDGSTCQIPIPAQPPADPPAPFG